VITSITRSPTLIEPVLKTRHSGVIPLVPAPPGTLKSKTKDWALDDGLCTA
jgi:hypothetical protein